MYVPQNAIAVDDGQYVEGVFGYSPRRVTLYASADSGGNALTKASLLAFMDMYTAMANTQIKYGGTTWTYTSICIQPAGDGNCDVQSVLDLWQYNRTTLENDADVLNTINQANLTDVLGRSLDLNQHVGGITRSGGNITSARALHLLLRVKNDKRDLGDGKKRAQQCTCLHTLLTVSLNA